MVLKYFTVSCILLVFALVSFKAHKLTLAGAIAGVWVGFAVFLGAGYTGVGLLAAFFVAGTAATSWKKKEKSLIKSKQKESSQRNAFQVIANGGVAAIAGLLAFFVPFHTGLFCLMLAASLASATADTLSSELGMVYGRRFYNIISFRKDEKGLDGVISLEGTLIGVAGAALIALIYSLEFGFNNRFFIIIIAGTVGNLADSVLGATLERKRKINNDVVNFLNTMVGALLAWAFFAVI
jgi:uncharacterized protein (TIGR00297 family)